MAFDLRDLHDPGYVKDNHTSRWTKEGQDDGQSLLESHCAHWCLFLSEFDLRKLDILVPECFLHPDA